MLRLISSIQAARWGFGMVARPSHRFDQHIKDRKQAVLLADFHPERTNHGRPSAKYRGDLITNTMCAGQTAGHYRRNDRPLNGPRSGLPGGLPLPFSTVSRLSAAASPRTSFTRSRRI